MKKILLLFSTIALLMTSCGEKNAFTITGKLPNGSYDGQQVYLQTLDSIWKDRINIDTVSVVDGQFVFKGVAKDVPGIHFISLENAPDFIKSALVVVEPGQIEMTLDSVSSVKGTTTNNSYQVFASQMDIVAKEMQSIWEKAKADTTANAELQAELEKEYEAKEKQKTNILFDFIKPNIQNQIGAYFLANNSYLFSLDQLKELVPSINPEFKSIKRIQKLETRVKALEATSVGSIFTDLKGKTPTGTDVSLSDFAGKGKYTLIDFWASWCPPCRAEMPKLVELYGTYKNKGLEIVGISLDKTNEDWVKGINTLKITWPQISDLKYWDSELAAAYGVNSIPHLVLLDKDGKIIERGLNAEQVSEKLAEFLK
ncbi:AhpC/TSA family protein [Dysgonomonas sp. BGC7]|uniref:AhpC/TSA family protein n=1 Tax=Dysgonomonas sp. BGC7 TaxID=1658008 RepID=UPI000680B18F|nr:AhpC/TSA family protein [Dysgonomonas sp. BGC7]MBD8389506.1 AhpC/TSA family protein [Dysgonomonas sp. BGC7]